LQSTYANRVFLRPEGWHEAFQAQSQCRGVALERTLDDFRDEMGSMRLEQFAVLNSAILDAARATGGIARDSFLKKTWAAMVLI
jgi:hypothetical protein